MNLLCFLFNDCNFWVFFVLEIVFLILHEQIWFWRTSYWIKLNCTGFQSIHRGFLGKLIHFQNKFRQQKLFKENISTKCFHERFSKENWAMGFLTDDNDFHCFSIVDKDFDRLLMDEIGWSDFSIDEVNFHSFSINHINFPEFTFKETSCHAMHLYEIVSPGDPLNEVILIFLSPLMKAVSMESISVEQTSGNFIDKFNLIVLKSSKLVFMKVFESKQFPRKYSSWNWLPGKFS